MSPLDPESPSEDDLPRVRRLFARHVKRSLFDAYLRPRKTTVKLVSTSISSSSFPGGEGMQFNASPRGQLLLAYNSSRIYVVDVRGDTPAIKREFRILRRPVAACIKDDASLLAVLTSETQVDVYDLTISPPRRKQAIILDNTPRTIAMSPCGSVLAAAYDGGIEVSSLNPGAMPSEKRSVKCDAVDSLAFSFDGTQILGTTTQSSPPSTVVLTAPYYDPGTLLTDDNIGAMWTTSILFPNSSRDCSHAVLLQDGSQEEAGWTFTYDRSFEAFRAVRIEDLRNGTTYFPGPAPVASSQAYMLPSTLAAATYHGDLAAAGFHGKEIWIYGVPDDLDACPEAALAPSDKRGGNAGVARRNSDRSSVSRNPSSRGRDPGDERVPQWQLLCDKLRNTLLPGSRISDIPGVTNVKWVAQFGGTALRERLVVTATGVSGPRLATDDEDFDFVDGGRVALLDFDYTLENGKDTEITIEVGADEAEVLEEERRDIETEVAIVRRRTVAQKHRGRTALLRAASTSARNMAAPAPPVPGSSTEAADDDDDPLVPRRIGQNPAQSQPPLDTPEDPDVATIEEQEAMDAPYTHASPRSAPTLRRAATAAAMSQRMNPTLAGGRPIEYRRADGRREHPHESDADNWVPPPPPYQKEDPGDLPAFLRGPAVAPIGEPPAPTGLSALADAGRAQAEPDAQPRDNTTQVATAQAAEPAMDRGALNKQEEAVDTETSYDAPADSPTVPDMTPSPPADVGDPRGVSPPGAPNAQERLVNPHPTPHQVPVMAVPDPHGSLPTLPPTVLPSGEQGPVSDAAPEQPGPAAAVPQAETSTAAPGSTNPPRASRLFNAQTWPANPAHNIGHRKPIPATAQGGSGADVSLPPAPSTNQVASLNRRISQGNPRRLSGGYRNSATLRASQTWPVPPQQAAAAPPGVGAGSDPDQPLIISTPQGITGSLDQPDSSNSDAPTETPLVAPVPRPPHPSSGLLNQRPEFGRLETIYSRPTPPPPPPPPPQEASHVPQPPPGEPQLSAERSRRWLVAPFRRSPSISPGAVPVGVSRQPSRAERSAARNIRDARSRGWMPRSRKTRGGKKKGRKAGSAADADMLADGAGWTEVSAPPGVKDSHGGKKCVVM